MESRQHTLDQLGQQMQAFKRAMMGAQGQFLTELQLTRSQLELLFVLSKAPGQTVGDIAGQLHLTNSSVTQTSETLVKRGLVERLHDEHDRRVVRLHLSASGQKLTDGITGRRKGWLAQMAADATDEELQAMLSVVTKLTNRLEAQNFVTNTKEGDN
jgi:DNA-binding MarR family transcriptional regulator